jgi:hypothetical protein
MDKIHDQPGAELNAMAQVIFLKPPTQEDGIFQREAEACLSI